MRENSISREIQLTQAYESNKTIFLKSEDEEYSSFGQTSSFSTASPSASSCTLANFEHEHQPQVLLQSSSSHSDIVGGEMSGTTYIFVGEVQKSDTMKKKVLSEGALSSMIDSTAGCFDTFPQYTNFTNASSHEVINRVHSSPDMNSLGSCHQDVGPQSEQSYSENQPGLDLALITDPLSDTNPEQYATFILESNGFIPTFYSALSLSSFFLEPTEAQIAAYGNEITGAVRTENLNNLRLMVQQGKPMQCCNRFGESVVHMACRMGSAAVIQFFLQEAGVSIRIRDDLGRTPLHDACWAREPNFDLVRILLQTDPDLILIRDKRGHSPLSYVRREHWIYWCRFLKQNSHLLIPSDLGSRRR